MDDLIIQLTQKAEQGDFQAAYELGLHYGRDGAAKDLEKSEHWMRLAAEAGHAKAQFGVSRYAKTRQEAFEWVLRSAEGGYRVSQLITGMNYRDSLDVPLDTRRAFYWFEKAANQNHAEAQYQTALMYYSDYGVGKDEQKYLYWLQCSAENGFADAQHLLALHYCHNKLDEAEKDYGKACHWLERAATQGFTDSEYLLGNILRQGLGVPKNEELAIIWLSKAAEKNNLDALFALGCIYMVRLADSKGGIHSYNGQRATELFSRAKKLGLAKADDGLKVLEEYAQIPAHQPPAHQPPVRQAPAKKSGCYIATAVYGSYDCPQVRVLRRYRDISLATSAVGRAFIKVYYCASPYVVRMTAQMPSANKLFKAVLDKLVNRLLCGGYQDSHYIDK